MSLQPSSVQSWYTQRLHDFYYDRYLAARGYTATGEPRGPDPDDHYPRDDELSPQAERIKPDALTGDVQEAYAFYHKNFTEADIGSVRVYRVPVTGETTIAVRTTTDGDDGYLEIFSEQGETLGTGRTNLNTVVWGTRDWLRDQVANRGEFPPEM